MTPQELGEGITLFLILLCSLCVHEWAHAFAADKLGDETPRALGRVTLNPAAHIDIVGTVILPLFMILMPGSSMVFGWGKPVLVQPDNFKCGVRKGDIIVSLAGPMANIALGILAACIGGFMASRGMNPRLVELTQYFMLLNAVLAGFNLLPIPPLDGFHVLRRAINMKDELYLKLTRMGFVFVLLIIMLPPVRMAVFFVITLVHAPMDLAFYALAGAQ